MLIEGRLVARPMLVLLLACSGVWLSTISEGAPVLFLAQELEDRRAAWSPREVVIRAEQNPERGHVFALENPTPRTHVFEAPGLLEQTVDQIGEPTRLPLRVTVAPGETVKVLVIISEPEGEPDPCGDGERCYDFFCPIHRGDLGEKGIIRVIGREGK